MDYRRGCPLAKSGIKHTVNSATRAHNVSQRIYSSTRRRKCGCGSIGEVPRAAVTQGAETDIGVLDDENNAVLAFSLVGGGVQVRRAAQRKTKIIRLGQIKGDLAADRANTGNSAVAGLIALDRSVSEQLETNASCEGTLQIGCTYCAHCSAGPKAIS